MALPVDPFRLRYDSSHRLSITPESTFESLKTNPALHEFEHAKAMNGAATKRKSAKPRVKATRDASRLKPKSPRGSRPHDKSPDKPVIDLEIPRKFLHSSVGAFVPLICPGVELYELFSGFVTLYLYTSFGDPKAVIVALSASLAVIIPADLLRLRYPSFERLYERVLGFLMRENEKVGVILFFARAMLTS